MASAPRGTLYIGVTNDLVRRVQEHKSEVVKGFTHKYGVHQLVHYEWSESVVSAIAREKQMKKWRRAWKIRLIEENNPEWRDLYPEVTGEMDSRLRGNDDHDDTCRECETGLSDSSNLNAQEETWT